MAELKNWYVYNKAFSGDRDPYYLAGFVYDHPRLADGKYVYTTSIQKIEIMSDYVIITTKNTDYIIRKDTIDPICTIAFEDLCKEGFLKRGNECI